MIVASKLNLTRLNSTQLNSTRSANCQFFTLQPRPILPLGSRHHAEAPPRENSVNDADLSPHTLDSTKCFNGIYLCLSLSLSVSVSLTLFLFPFEGLKIV